MCAGEGVGLEPGDVDDGLLRVQRVEPPEAPLGAQVRRPPSRSSDVVLLLPRPALVGPPLATLVAAALDERQVGGVRDRGAADQVLAHIGAVMGALVVVGELTGGRADRAFAPGDPSTNSRPVRAGPDSRERRSQLRRLVIGQPGQLKRLEHRLVVLVLVAEHHLVQEAVADAALLDHLERPRADLLEVLARLAGSQERKITAVRARCLERVVDIGEVVVEQRPAAVAVDEPQVLERGDVAEVPHERAHRASSEPARDPRRRPTARARASARGPRPGRRSVSSADSVALAPESCSPSSDCGIPGTSANEAPVNAVQCRA